MRLNCAIMAKTLRAEMFSFVASNLVSRPFTWKVFVSDLTNLNKLT
jgi:hypothetical protein